MKKIILLLSILIITMCDEGTKPSNYQTEIANLFKKEHAFETVKLMEKYWRVAGNTGFNASVAHIEKNLIEAGFVNESEANTSDRLIYRIEKRPMSKLTWEPVSGTIDINGATLLDFKTNRHMVALNSYSFTGDIEIIQVTSDSKLSPKDVKNKLVYGEMSSYQLYKTYVEGMGAKGIVSYSMPKYLKPEINTTSIQFRSIPQDSLKQPFGIILSNAANTQLKEALKKGKVQAKIDLKTTLYPSTELTVIAELKGNQIPDERFVYSAHIQEPGANDNATGVATLLEMAKTSSILLSKNIINPKRTMTFLFGDEIISTRRFVTEDTIMASKIKWGMSLDMVGEKTEVTGGTFLIEKMPDPSAIWTRGEDKHSEWGGRALKKSDMRPHYFNDFVINRMKERAAVSNWIVNTNPFEGGSDHVPFLRANIPGLLLWHFTDQFYHTDQDRLDKVDPNTMENVGIGALSIGLMLTSSNEQLQYQILDEVYLSVKTRLDNEINLSLLEIKNGADKSEQMDIVYTWLEWYQNALESIKDININDMKINKKIDEVKDELKTYVSNKIEQNEEK